MLALYLLSLNGENEKGKFETLYTLYKGLMLSRAYEILGDRDYAEDAVHNAFMRILNNLDKLEEPEHPRSKGFVMIVLENVAKTMYVKRKKEKIVELDENIAWDKSVEADAERKLTAEYVAEKIAALPEKYRDVMVLKYLNGLNDKEIASALGISPAAARKRLQRSRESLRILLGGSYGKSVE